MTGSGRTQPTSCSRWPTCSTSTWAADYALWHDRAVYHFLTEPEERSEYLTSLRRSVQPEGWLVVATFGPDGPTTCSGLPIVRYTHDELAAQFPGFELVDTAGEDHLTPWGTNQQFTAVLMRRSS